MIPGLAEKLKIERKKSGLSQAVIAERVGSTTDNLYKYESETNAVPSEILWKLANLYHVSIDYLTGNEGDDVFVAKGITPEEKEIFIKQLEYFEKLRLNSDNE